MKATLNYLILSLVVLSLWAGVISFGGILPEYALVFYALVAITTSVWGVKWIFCRRVSGIWIPLHVPVLTFLGYSLLRYFTSPVEHDSRVDLLHIGIYVTLYFLVAQNLHRSRDRLTILWALIILAVAQSFYGLWQYKTGSDQVLWLERGLDYHGRGSGTYYCPNHLAGFLEMALGLIVGWLIAYRNPDSPLQNRVLRNLFAVAALGFIGLGLYSTGSRGGWIAVGAAIPVLLVLAEVTRAVPSRILIIVFVIFACGVAGVASIRTVRERVSQTLAVDLGYRWGEQPVEVKGGIVGRTPIWRSTLRLIRDHPVIGTGPGTWRWMQLKYRLPESSIRPDFAHNDPLQLVAEYGLIGLILILAVFVCFYWQAIQLTRTSAETATRAFAIGALAAVTAILIHSFVDFNFHIPANASIVAVILGLVAAPALSEKERTRVPLLIKTVFGITLIALSVALAWVGRSRALASRAASRGFAAAQEHEWDDAVREYQTALRLDPHAPEIHSLIGDIYRTQSSLTTDEDLQEERKLIARRGVDSYKRALELNPYHPEIMLKMAAACELAGDPAQAFRWYQQAFQVDPNNAFAWIALGNFYRRQGDTVQAIAALEHARKLNPGDSTAVNILKQIRSAQP
ncbi:MAG: hypothetical protein PCFJNLEI_02003 [Verrucomicrobiae bacterium]|nr:hypothetical protein [Verrucomicrobiae bacterium]